MDKTKTGIVIPRQSLIYIGLCLTGVAIFLLGGIVPASRTVAELDRQTAMARFRLEEQKTLAPYQQMMRENEGKKASGLLPMPDRSRLPQAQINTIPLSLANTAKENGMSVVSAVPNPKGITADASLLPVNVVLRGSFVDFRKFLIALGGIPYIEHIEEILIEGKPEGREYRLTLWVAIG